MKILLFSSLYPPKIIGGAEVSAGNLAEWLSKKGIEVGVVRSATRDELEGEEVTTSGIRIWRVITPHIYPIYEFQSAPIWQKPIWHLQDHFDPRIGPKIGSILDAFRPDLVNVHLLQGLGYQALKETATRGIRVNYVLPDLSLACVRGSMFKERNNCEKQCGICKLSSFFKWSLLTRQSSLTFVSPSRANLQKLANYLPIKSYPHRHILNPNYYPPSQIQRLPEKRLRLLYAGRLHESKGLSLLLEAVSAVAPDHHLLLTLAGNGPMEAAINDRFGQKDWLRMLGFISHSQLADEMATSDLLCIPSIWAENSPGVVIQALGQGLPVLGSKFGGIPELVKDGINGRVIEEATPQAWAKAIEETAKNPTRLSEWRAAAMQDSSRFSQDAIGSEMLAWLQQAGSRTTYAGHNSRRTR